MYQIEAVIPKGKMAGQFTEAAGVLQPSSAPINQPLIDEWKIDDAIIGGQIRLSLYGDRQSRRLVPLNSDPAFRLLRLFTSLAGIHNGLILHELEKMHYFQYADGLELQTAIDLLSANERMNTFLEAMLGSWRNLSLQKAANLAVLAGIDPQTSEHELRRLAGEWYKNADVWSTRIAGFSHQAKHFLHQENGVEKSKLAQGDRCYLVREPYNPDDPNAVTVLHQSGKKLGYLRRTIAEHIAPIIDLGAVFRAKVGAFLPDDCPVSARVYLAVERVG